MLLVVYGLVVLVFTALFLAYAAQGAPLPPKPVYPAFTARIEAVARPEPTSQAVEPVWCERTRRFRDPVTGRFVARSKVV